MIFASLIASQYQLIMQNKTLLLILLAYVASSVTSQTVNGYVTRLYPQGTRIYFHLSNDGFTGQFSNYLFVDSANASSAPYQATYDLLLKSAGTSINVTASKGATIGGHYLVNYIYVDY